MKLRITGTPAKIRTENLPNIIIQRHHYINLYSFKYNQQDGTLYKYSLLLSMLYMFQAVSPSIIRSSKLYTQHLVYAKLACCYR